MADRVYLSLWLRDFQEQNMLPYWRRAIEEFPASQVLPGVRSLTIYPLDWGGTPVLEESFRQGATAEHAVALASEFLHDDYAYEAQLQWDIWMPKSPALGSGWERTTRVVSVMCLGTGFEEGRAEESGHLQINFGLDSAFLPPEEWLMEPGWPEEVAEARLGENLEHLLEYERRVEKGLPLARRLLWCESGENLAEKIRLRWQSGT